MDTVTVSPLSEGTESGSTTAMLPATPTLRPSRNQLSRASRSKLRRLELLAIILPLLFLGAAEAARVVLFQHDLSGASSHVFFFGLMAVGIIAFSRAVFRTIEGLQERVVRQNERLAALNTIATATAESPGLDQLLNTGLQQLLAAVSADAGIVCAVDLERGEHSAVASRGFSEQTIRGLQRSKICDDAIALEVVVTGRPVVREHLRDDPSPTVAEVAERENVKSVLSVPLKSHAEIVGIIAIASRTERRFGETELELVSSVAGQLGMAIQHAAMFEESLRRNREMEALLTVSKAATSSLDLPHLLDHALAAILQVTSADAAELWLVDNDDLTLAHHRGASPKLFHKTNRLRAGEGLPGAALERRELVATHDLRHDPTCLRLAVQEAGFETYCAVPLLHGGDAHGVLGVASRDREALMAPDELRLLAGVSEVVAVAIENACLHERVQDTAVIEERERIAREMHDGLAQVLTYVNAQTLAIGTHLHVGEHSQAERGLAQMKDAVQDVYADVREAILGLRTSPGADGGLAPSLRRYLASFEEASAVQARLEIGDGAEAVDLSPSVEIQLMRIVQEALSNVRKHAHARTATVRFILAGQTLRIIVEDDGRGFDPERLSPRGWPRFGLQTMRERAEAIGGHFRILSRPGGGTSAVIELALEQPSATGGNSQPAVAGSAI